LCDKSNEERRRNNAEIPCNMVSLPVLSKEAYRGGVRTCDPKFLIQSMEGRLDLCVVTVAAGEV
jgi:hypothetical protein